MPYRLRLATGAALLALLPLAGHAEPGSFDAVRGDRAGGWTAQSRSEVMALNGMVATSQPLASEAGLEVLHAGGNAFDAAVATAAAINVVEPEATGIGGDMFVIAWVAKEKRLVALDAAGRAPSGANLERYRKMFGKSMPEEGIHAALVPGAVDGWSVLLARYGKLGLGPALQPAIRIADQGFPLTERIGGEWQVSARLLAKDPDSAKTYMPGGKSLGWGDIFRNPDLAGAFRLIAKDGRDAFYKGPIAKAIVAKSQSLGGGFALADFDTIRARWVEPISTTFKGTTIHEMPPSTQGFAVLQIMNMLEVCPAKLGLGPLGPRSADYWHLMVEAKKLAYADLKRFNGDPDYSAIPVARLISKDYAAQQCSRIDMKKSAAIGPDAPALGGTAYITTADKEGNVVSLIYSVYDFFGSGVTVPGYGFVLSNRGNAFSLDPASPNAIAPGKRPFYTIIPGFVTKDGKPFFSFGVMQGGQQAQGQAQVLANLLAFGANVQSASDAARFNHNQQSNELRLESGLYDLVGADLAARGHKVIRDDGSEMGGYQGIMIDPRTGAYRGGSDHRKDGMAVGY
ncbi:gamma-glutamyltranspeptidase [Novosphingobium sediminis]|uniref:Glutathione hydrolase proenzyme n=1 Tax=Novosphingobium sediminis TaxID=707214 RepID=A0A512AH28_9SPHN|nr:gamma-glutamyltransferase [Novosphingobium sediminis]GEN98981.1 gamma-glutamyltranspeptidase [Novosphingobium sediminis]